MKAMNSISNDLFFNPAAAATLDTWYDKPRPARRKKAAALRRALLEQQENKQETVCSVILVLSALCSLAIVFAQSAAS